MRPASVLLVLGLLLAHTGCRCGSGAPPAPAVTASPSRPLRVEFAGCAAVLRGPVCELPADRSLRLWVEAPAQAPLAILAGGARLPVQEKPVQGGRLCAFGVPSGATEVVVEVGPAEAKRTWRLPLHEAVEMPVLKQVEALRAKGEEEEQARVVHEMAPGRPEAERARIASLLARQALSQGRHDDAVARLREALAFHRRAGQRSGEVNDALVLSYTLTHHGQHFDEARAIFEALGPLGTDYPEGAAHLPYYQGRLARASGDVRSALRLFAEAEARAERLGMARQHRTVRQVLALTLQYIGRDAESLAMLEGVLGALPADAAPCERAHLLNDIGWGLLLAGEAGTVPRGREPAPSLEQALALYRQGCHSPDDEANVLVNLALAELQGGRSEAAEKRLEEARRARAEPGARLALWWLDVEARVHLEAGRARQAWRLFSRLGRLAEASLSPEARWRAALGQAQALERQGNVEAALAVYAQAEALLDDEMLRIPVVEGRHGFLRERERGSRAYVALAVRAGRVAEALEVARRARVRLLEVVRLSDRVAGLPAAERSRWDAALSAWREARVELEREAERDWSLSEERLAQARQARKPREARLRALLDEALATLGPAHRGPSGRRLLWRPGPGELQLAYHPVPGGWVGFAADDREVTARMLGPLAPDASPAALATALLEPFRVRILAAERVTFIPYGVLRAVDFHALPFEGDVLLASRPVAYALDLPRPGQEASPPEERHALIVADPQGNLPHAREEARRVQEALADAGPWRVRVRSGPDATGTAVRDALERVDLFHYAGHGHFAGLGGWDSTLLLAEGQLTVGDVLALRRVPPWVVLSGCETARAAQESPVEGMGLAQAFLVSGARGVVAAWRVVDDAHALRLMEGLYRHARLTRSEELPAALRRAQLELRTRNPTSDWAAFRVLVP